MKRITVGLAATALALLTPGLARAGGGAMNVMVVYSSDDSQATGVAHHYETVRSLPKGHLCGLPGIVPSMTNIDVPTFQSLIRTPLDACFAALPDPSVIDYLVLVRGLPYSVSLPTYAASLEALLQVGHTQTMSTMMDLAGQGQPMNNTASVPNPDYPQSAYFNAADSTVMNQYSGWYALGDEIISATDQPKAFRRKDVMSSGDYTFADNVFIVQSLDGFDYQDATDLADRGVQSDGTMPTAEILCMAGSDDARAARDPECELTTRMLAGAGFNGVYLDSFDGGLTGHNVAAYFTGTAGLQGAIAGNTYVPGAIADNLTSYGAATSNFFCDATMSTCPASESQTSIARFIRAGASGAHGTVNEPLNNVFENAGTLLYYTFGYSMGESYFYNQRFLYWQNIHLGDPLATPYAKRPVVTVDASTQPIVVSATHDDGIAHVELWIDGKQAVAADADTVSFTPDAATIGSTVELYAFAVANDVPVTRTGWPQPMQTPHAQVQGWSLQTAVVPPVDASTASSASASGAGGSSTGSSKTTSTSGAGGERSTTGADVPLVNDDGSSGCSCETPARERSAPLTPIALAGLLLFTFGRRRDRRTRG